MARAAPGDERVEARPDDGAGGASSPADGNVDPLRDFGRAILESISDGVFTVDADWRITFLNRAGEEILGTNRREVIGRPCRDVFRASMCDTDCALRRTLDSGVPIIARPATVLRANGERIPVSVSTALLRDGAGRVVGGAETFRDLSVIEQLRSELRGGFRTGDMVSRSPAMGKVLELIPIVAESDSTVLIQGETGTGKELLARAVHAASRRADRPFVAVNCGALPDTLLESELFGYKSGAFTGAVRDKPGRFALAEHGTLFLDEVAEVSPALQVRLLRVLQDRFYEPLGATRAVKANVRILAATNKDLAHEVDAGAFRQDLYYRLNVVRLDLPPLRERREDIPLLVEHFIERFNRTQGRSVPGIGATAMAILMAHDYPGNIRELQNAVAHAFVLCGDGPIQPEHLPEEIVGRYAASRASQGVGGLVRVVEASAICEALKRNRGNRLAAARELGLHKSTFFRKVRALGISLPPEDGRSRR